MLENLHPYAIVNACHARLMLLDTDSVVQCVNGGLRDLLAEVDQLENNSFLSHSPDALTGRRLEECLNLPAAQLRLTPRGGEQRLRLTLTNCRLEAAASEVIDERRGHAGWLLTWRKALTRPGPSKALISELEAAIDGLARCDLRPLDNPQHSVHTERFYQRLALGLANLSEAMRQNRLVAANISRTAADISMQNTALAQRTHEQAGAIEATSANMEELTGTVRATAENAHDAAALATNANRLADIGRQEVLRVVESMASIDRSSDQVRGIIDVINEIAFQTNILALNAAVEAARAGEHGRGFSVVATEVRALAQRSSNAANEIKGLIEESLLINARGKQQAKKAEESMGQVVEGVRETSLRIDDISAATREQHQGIQDAKDAVKRIEDITRQNQQLEEELAVKIHELESQDTFLSSATQVFRLPESEFTHQRHQQVSQIAQTAAEQIGRLLEAGVAGRELVSASLFDIDYQPIQGTDPQKFSTGFDAFADRRFPEVQEAILRQHPDLLYAISTDHNGYVPTHNDAFAQPLTGDRDSDFAANRTKRIFDDPVGWQAGRHTDAYKLQTYRRDTGELIFDLSVPIYVNGRHWGGFRIGYRIT